MKTITLAEKQGKSTHISALLQKARRLGLDAEGLEQLAIQRGCTYYANGDPSSPLPVNHSHFSDEELAIALISPSLPATSRSIRLAAALIGAEGARHEEIASLAKQEGCADVVGYIADCGLRFEPANPFWKTLRELVPQNNEIRQLPHPTRFVEMTGIDRGFIGLRTRWIRPLRRAAT